MANFKQYLCRQEVTEDPMGDFIKDVQRWVDDEWKTPPFRRSPNDRPFPVFPSDYEHGWELYENFLKEVGACWQAIEIGEKWWDRFVKENDIIPTKKL